MNQNQSFHAVLHLRNIINRIQASESTSPTILPVQSTADSEHTSEIWGIFIALQFQAFAPRSNQIRSPLSRTKKNIPYSQLDRIDVPLLLNIFEALEAIKPSLLRLPEYAN
jgi:hypothetical protein